MTVSGTRSRRNVLPAVFNVEPSYRYTKVSESAGGLDRWQTRLVFLSTALGAFLVTANVSTMNVRCAADPSRAVG